MEIVCIALQVYTWVLLARIILSWVQMGGARTPDAMGPVVKVIYDLTEPVLGFFRRIIPPFGPLDLSPLIVFIILNVVRGLLGCRGIF